MKHFYITLTIVFLLPLFSNAQSNYKPGYVVSLNGDTLKGFIDYKEWDHNPRQLNFKNDINSKQSTQYTVANSLSFGVNGLEYYRRYYLGLSNDYIEITKLSAGIDTTTTKDTVFLRIITTGKNLTLFAYTDNIKQRLFVAEGNSSPVELIYHTYFYSRLSTVIVNSTGYKLQLQRWASIYQPTDETLRNDIQRTGYFLKNIAKIVNEINGLDTKLLAGYYRTGHKFFAGVGINDEVTSAKSDAATVSGGKSSSVFPKIDIGVDQYFNKNVRKFLLRTELSVTGSNTSIVTNGFVNTAYTQTLKFKRYKASLNPQLIFNAYNGDNIKFYIGAGLALNYSTYSNKENRIIYYIGGQPLDPADEEFPNVQNLSFTITARTGVTISDKFDVYIGYLPASALNENIGYSLRATSYQAGVNYFFGGK